LGNGRASSLLSVLVLACLAAPSSASAASLAPFLDQARAARDALPPMAFSWASKSYIGDNAHVAPTVCRQREEGEVRRKGDLTDVIMTRYIAISEDEDGTPGAEPEPNGESRTFWDGERTWHRQRPLHPAVQNPVLEASVDTDPAYGNRLRFLQHTGAFLEGRFWHNHEGGWIDILEAEPQAWLEDVPEPVDGFECRVVRAATAHGAYTLWIDPAHGYAIRRAEITVEADDRAWGAPLSEAGKLPPEFPKPEGYVERDIARLEITIEDVVVSEIDGYYIPTAGTQYEKSYYADGTVNHVKNVVTRKDIELNPDFEAMGAFQVDFPEGTDVTLEYGKNGRMRYTWQDGELVTKVNENVLAQIDADISSIMDSFSVPAVKDIASVNPDAGVARQAPQPAAGQSDVWFWMLAGAAVAVALGFIAMRRLRKAGNRGDAFSTE